MRNAKKAQPTLQVFNCEMRPVPPGTKRRGPRPLRGCEWAIPGILVAILKTGLERIAALSKSADPAACALEAEHLRHLPALLAEFDPEVLDHYWNIERIGFMQQALPAAATAFEPLWKDLGEVLEARREEVRSGSA